MKKNKGFTLIELLAIIVILAIIAVITVPIILNIIEDSKQGAAINSAYGYKDAINKWYVSKLQEDSNYKLNGDYTISEGKLNNIEIPLSGDKPKNGNLHYTNNTLDRGCLTIGDYKITFDSNGRISETIKGDCNSNDIVLSCSNDEYLYETFSYIIEDQEACETFFNEVWNCDNDEECIEEVANFCQGEVNSIDETLEDYINKKYINFSDIENFVEKMPKDSWCRPKNEECFEFTDNGDGTAKINAYLCGAESIFIPDSPGSDFGHMEYNTEGKILDVSIPSQLTGKNGKLTVTAIGDSAFIESQLTSVTIPNSVTTIEYSAFKTNQLTSITLPNNLTTIGSFAFSSNHLTSLILPNNLTTIGQYAFSENNLTYIVISPSVTTIEEAALCKYPAGDYTLGSNLNLTTIYNNTGRSFNWKSIVGSPSSATFETGTINNSAGNITVTTGSPSN